MKRIQDLKVSIFINVILLFVIASINASAQTKGNIYLYGELHAVERILDKELEIWGDYYNNQGLRHLFLETPYYTAEFLNMWINAEDDEILDQIYDELKGTASHHPAVRKFYVTIKTKYPETVFHGTDVGHQHHSTGQRYLTFLSQQNKDGSEQYQLAKESIAQGKHYYSKKGGDVYRENNMVANFVREFNQLQDESIMGIYGGAHTGFNDMIENNTVPSMANQLHEIYENQIFTTNLAGMPKDRDPLRTESILVNGVAYKALYFGQQDLSGFKDYAYREYWLLEGAYDDFKEDTKPGDVLPYSNYPMEIDSAQVFIIDYMKVDSTKSREYYRSDGKLWKNHPTTEEFIPGE